MEDDPVYRIAIKGDTLLAQPRFNKGMCAAFFFV